MNLKPLIIIFLFSVAPSLLFAGIGTNRYCSERDPLRCLIIIESKNEVKFYIESKSNYEFTMTITMNLQNAETKQVFPYIKSFSNTPKKHLFTIYRKDNRKSWNYKSSYRWRIGALDAIHDNYVYALPYENGASFKVLQGNFGSFSHKKHAKYAVDFKMPIGTPVFSARGGIVVSFRNDATLGGDDVSLKGKGNFIHIRHSDKTIGNYGHLSYKGVLVKQGDVVERGQLIGYSGSTGYSSGPHLHFEVHKTISGTERQTIPINFKVAGKVISKLSEGTYYKAVH